METQNNYEFQITNYANSAKYKPTPSPSQEGNSWRNYVTRYYLLFPLLGGARGGFVRLVTALVLIANILYLTSTATAQNNVGIGTTTPNSKAILELQATDKGLLTPRLTQLEMLAITTPPNGLLVYNTNKNCFYYFDNVTNTWKDMCSIGATGKDTLVLNLVQIDSLFAHLIKTDTLLSKIIITNYIKADTAYIKFLTSQYIKTDSIKAGFGRFDSIYVNGQNITDYINSQLTNTLATKDTVVLKYLRTDSIYSILIKADSAFIKSILTNTLTATYITTDSIKASFGRFDSMYVNGQNIMQTMSDSIASQAWLLKGNNASATNKLGTLNAQDLHIVTGGTDKITILNGTGNVGIGQLLPSAKLDVAGDVKFDNDLRPAGLSGNVGDVLVSSGTAIAPVWVAPSTIVPTTTNTLTNTVNTINSTVNGVSATAPAVNTVSNTLTGTNITTTVNGVAGTPLDLSSIIPASNNWNLLGNAGTTAGTNFLGTTDAQDVVFKRNNAQAGLLGANNTSFGVNALNPLSTGNFNVAVGSNSLFNNTTGYDNVAVGNNTLNATTTGFHNVALGLNAMQANTLGSQNIAMGYAALNQNTTGTNNVAIGVQSLFLNTNSYNTSVGAFNMESNTAGTENTSVGNMAMLNNTTGAHNTATGYQAILTNTTGADNTAHGYQALYSNTTGFENTANGYQALYNTTSGFENTATGFKALFSNTNGNYNIATGFQALYNNTSGILNTAIGHNSLYFNTIGSYNTANGVTALSGNTTGNYNVASGLEALFSSTTGNDNTALGHRALFTNTTGSNNTTLGAYADVSTNNLTNATAIGYNAKVGASNSLVLGGTAVDAVNVGITTTTPETSLDVAGKGQIWVRESTGGGLAATAGKGFKIEANSLGGILQAYDYATATSRNIIMQSSGGDVGIGNIGIPANKLEISHGTAGNSGLRLTNLTNAGILSTNASGDVINNTTPNVANGLFWGLTGNSGTAPATNFVGTTDAQDFVTRTNNTEKMRVTSAGNVGINTTTPTAKLTALSSNNTEDAITGNHTSGSTTTAYHGVKGNVTNVAYTSATGYLAYHNTANATYGMYATGGNYAGVLLNKTYIGNVQPTIAINTADLEVSNVTAGTTAANLTLRQSTALTVASSDMGYLNFGDNTLAAPQASIRASRDLAGGAGDLPTRLTFHTTPDASTTLTERMRITENGNVGIGTINPLSKLHVFNAGNADIRSIAEGGFSGIQAWSYNTGAQHPYFMGFASRGTQLVPTYPLSGDVLSAYLGRDAIDGNSANYGGASIYMKTTENYSASNKGTNIIFSTTANTTNNALERMFIAHNGNVGVNNNTPLFKLHVSGGSTSGNAAQTVAQFGDAGTAAGALYLTHNTPTISGNAYYNAGWFYGGGTGKPATIDLSGAGLQFFTSNNAVGVAGAPIVDFIAPRMSIASNGNVGINNPTPAYKLDVVNTDPAIQITGINRMSPIITSANASNFHASWNEVGLSSPFNFTGTQYGAVNRITIGIAQTGTVGGVIGSTNDASNTSVSTVTSAIGGVFYVSNTGGGTITNGYGLRIEAITATNKWSLYAADASAPSYFAGSVGIGTTAPTALLSVNGAANNTTGAWGIFSDARVKTVNSEFTDGLNVINKIRPVRFTYNDNAPLKGTDEQIGIVAQELELLAPYMVTKKDYKDIKELRQVNNQAYTFLLINSVQQQQKLIENQQAQIDELKKAIELLQKK
jgi:hypothetical protein